MRWMIGLLSVACVLPTLAGTLFVGAGPEVTPKKLRHARQAVARVQRAEFDLDNPEVAALLGEERVAHLQKQQARIETIPLVQWRDAVGTLGPLMEHPGIARVENTPPLDCADLAAVLQRADQVCSARGLKVAAVRAGAKRARFHCAARGKKQIWGVEICATEVDR